jgi:hypothetical protein
VSTNDVVVSGDDAPATTIAEELKNAGACDVKLDDTEVADSETEVVEAGVGRAAATICAGNGDSTNLDIAVLARKADPDVRVVARLANDVLREAVADNGPGAILDVAELAASSVVEPCLARATHPFEFAGIQFVLSGTAGNFASYEHNKIARLGPSAVRPHRMTHRRLTRD